MLTDRFKISRAAITHLRIVYSLNLLPIFLFATSQSSSMNGFKALWVLVILQFLIYPASNGYNSYFDKDEQSIGGVKNPPRVGRDLYFVSIFLEIVGVILGFFVSTEFALGVFIYGIFSKMYSHPWVRLKANPALSFLVIFIFQGAFTYWLCLSSVSGETIAQLLVSKAQWIAGGFASCMIGAVYVLTQVYQHDEDKKRGDKTLSLLLGYRGSFLFTVFFFFLSALLLFIFFDMQGKPFHFWLFVIFSSPIVIYFLQWMAKVWNNQQAANFENVMKMSRYSSVLLSAYFIVLFFVNHRM